MRQRGFTRASTLGPIADVIIAAGGSAKRVFARAELPLALQQTPEVFVPLKDHFNLLQLAAREVADELFGARLGQLITVQHLGVYGQWVSQAPTLLDAIGRANRSLDKLLQSATDLRLRIENTRAVWSYESQDVATEGRQQNEMLALCHMIEIARQYLGSAWLPDYVLISGRPVQARSELEQLLKSSVLFRGRAGALMFDRRLLATLRPKDAPSSLTLEALGKAIDVPNPGDLHDTVNALLDLELIERLPSIAWVARKMGMAERTLQRHLANNGTRFSALLQTALQRRASDLLLQEKYSITEIASSLGYSDAAHFSRAFKRWTGLSPQAWRENGAAVGWVR